jgi:hypothetical protein
VKKEENTTPFERKRIKQNKIKARKKNYAVFLPKHSAKLA